MQNYGAWIVQTIWKCIVFQCNEKKCFWQKFFVRPHVNWLSGKKFGDRHIMNNVLPQWSHVLWEGGWFLWSAGRLGGRSIIACHNDINDKGVSVVCMDIMCHMIDGWTSNICPTHLCFMQSILLIYYINKTLQHKIKY